jgi:SAM-dependent methyltransferase
MNFDEQALASNILYQRTDLGRRCNSAFFRKVLRVPIDSLVRSDAKRHHGTILREYHELMRLQWSEIVSVLPSATATILDIGCGAGGIHPFSYQAFGQNCGYTVYLVDRNQVDHKVYFGFEKEASAYNSLELTVEYLRHRGVPGAALKTYDVNKVKPPESPKMDVIVSLISWGFHYPVSTYLDYAKRVLAKDGVMVLDCRKGKEARDALQNEFSVSVLAEGEKHYRLKCVHQQ